MNAFVIEVAGERKEAFAYERPFNEGTMKALVEYAKASYGGNAELRRMSQQEEHEFKTSGIEFFKGGQ
jgi:hypothetical protein